MIIGTLRGGGGGDYTSLNRPYEVLIMPPTPPPSPYPSTGPHDMREPMGTLTMQFIADKPLCRSSPPSEIEEETLNPKP